MLVIGEMTYDAEDDPNPAVPFSFAPWVEPVQLYPAPLPISIPQDTPGDVRSPIERAAAAIWLDAAAAGNRLRVAVERLLTHLKVRRFHINKHRKRVREGLHTRIVIYRKTNPDVADLLLAVKWLGNEGTHDDLLRGDVLDGFEIMEQVLESLFGKTRTRVAKVAKEIVRRKGSRRRKGRRPG